MLMLEALVRGQQDTAIDSDSAEKCEESLQENIRDEIGDETRNWCSVYHYALGSSGAEKEMRTWKIAQICIWP